MRWPFKFLGFLLVALSGVVVPTIAFFRAFQASDFKHHAFTTFAGWALALFLSLVYGFWALRILSWMRVPYSTARRFGEPTPSRQQLEYLQTHDQTTPTRNFLRRVLPWFMLIVAIGLTSFIVFALIH